MTASAMIVVGGILNGQRVVSAPLPANEALRQFYMMQKQGYLLLTMTNAETGHHYDIGKFMFPGLENSQ
jgi:hypothetical protein